MREKRARSQDKSEPFFDFALTDADYDEPFVLDVSDLPPETLDALKSQYEHLDALDRKQPASPALSEEADPEPLMENDPLHTSLFVGHHRRMEREERRMHMLERQQLMITASRVRQQREQLLKADWKAYIEKVVKINDTSDNNELRRKRDLALGEIQHFLQKFEEYNARYNRRDSRPGDAERKRLQAKQKRAKAAKQKIGQQQRVIKVQLAEQESDDADIALELRPCAFGYMLPPRPLRPHIYELPAVVFEEVKTYDVVAGIMKKLSRK